MKLNFCAPILWIFLLVLLPQLTEAQAAKNPEMEIPCSTFRTGRFQYTSAGRQGIWFKRTNRKQIEYNVQTGEKVKFKVEWERDTTCQYVLTFKKSNLPTKLRKGWEIKVNIVNTAETFYDYRSDRYGIRQKGSVEKILSKAEKMRKEREAREEAEKYEKMQREQARIDSLKAIGEWEDPGKEDENEGEVKEDEGKKDKDKGKDKGKDKEDEGEGDPEAKDKKEKKKKDKPKKEKKEKKPKKEKEKKPKKEKKKKDKDESEEGEEGDSDDG